MYILTHRGLDPTKKPYFPESSRGAFLDQLNRGYGLEFDIQFLDDGNIYISHNVSVDLNSPNLIYLPELLNLISISSSGLSALHLKYFYQKPDYLDRLLVELEKIDLERLVIFDVTIETAKYLKEKNPKLNLAPSVAHEYDIERFNKVVGGTLITIDEVIKNKHLFSWVWLDEWDRSLLNGDNKTLYNKENFEILRKNGFKVVLVMPELHATSPGLLGGEVHQDAKDMETLIKRMKEIIKLKPNAVCTDWPDLVSSLLI